MDAKTYPLQEILKPERRYIIPTFQRDYEWTRDGQWQLLWEDLEATADRLLVVRESEPANSMALKNQEKAVAPHFLGAVVCGSLPFGTGGVALRSVIDGQQRLTTVQLLVRGLLDILQETGSDRSKSIRRMLFNPDDVVEEPDEVFKLWPRRRDRELWPIAMNDEVPAYNENKDHLYLQARRFFSESARTASLNEEGQADPQRLVALADAVSSLFKLVVIDLDDNDDAQVIFEVLNGRQTPLAAIDLVKNLLFLRAEMTNDDVETLYDQYWAGFDDDWWKAQVGTGHAQRGRRDVLLSTWLTATTGDEANVSHLYQNARTYLHRDDAPDTESVLKELSQYATAYRYIYEALPESDERLRASYQRLNALNITTAVPLLAWLRVLPSTTLPHEDHVRAVRAIESWSLRRAWVGWQTRGYNNHFVRVLRDARAAATAGDNVASAIITSLLSALLSWPTNEDLREAFVTRRFYGPVNQGRIRLMLSAIDAKLRSENPHEPSIIVEVDPLQVEHVLPQKWKDHWPVLDDQGQPVNPTLPDHEVVERVQARTRAVDRIGNLTLVTGAFNRDVSNLAWSVKKPEFEKQTALIINKQVAASEAWDEAAIEERAVTLAEVAARVWPEPNELA